MAYGLYHTALNGYCYLLRDCTYIDMVTCGNFMVQAYIYSTKEVFHTGEGNFEKKNYGHPRFVRQNRLDLSSNCQN